MTSVNLSKTGSGHDARHNPEEGDWFADQGAEDVYIVARVEGLFTLVNLKHGDSYDGLRHENPNDVFAGDDADFVKIPSVAIIY